VVGRRVYAEGTIDAVVFLAKVKIVACFFLHADVCIWVYRLDICICHVDSCVYGWMNLIRPFHIVLW
jgi:hypothetical protein